MNNKENKNKKNRVLALDMRLSGLALIAILVIALLLVLAGCSRDNTQENIEKLVRGNIDAVYKGIADEEFMELAGMTEAQVEEAYSEAIKAESVYFSYYTGIIEELSEESYDALPAETKTSIENMYKEIYQKAKYNVRDPEQEDDGSYSVEVIIEPMDVLNLAVEQLNSGEYEPYNEFANKYNVGEIAEEEFIPGLADVLVNLVMETLPESGYMESKTFVLKVDRPSEEQPFNIGAEEWEEIDANLIYYPAL